MTSKRTSSASFELYPDDREKLDQLVDATNLTYSEILRRLIRAGTAEMVLAQPRLSRRGRPRLAATSESEASQ